MCYSWEVLKQEEFEGLFSLAKTPVEQKPKFCWLTSGEIWTICGLDRYGFEMRKSRDSEEVV